MVQASRPKANVATLNVSRSRLSTAHETPGSSAASHQSREGRPFAAMSCSKTVPYQEPLCVARSLPSILFSCFDILELDPLFLL